MQESTSQFSKTELHIVMQGLSALQSETIAHRTKVITWLVPGDNNAPTLLEYYDKRSVQLQALQKKIAGLANSS